MCRIYHTPVSVLAVFRCARYIDNHEMVDSKFKFVDYAKCQSATVAVLSRRGRLYVSLVEAKFIVLLKRSCVGAVTGASTAFIRSTPFPLDHVI